VRLAVGYPDREGEERILANRVARRMEATEVPQVVSADDMLAMQAGVERLHVDPDIMRYCVDLAAATRVDRSIEVGASPRGSQSLMLVARALAVIEGREYVTPEDVKRVAVPALAHRLSLTPAAWAAGTDAATIVAGIVGRVPGPASVGRG